MVVKIIMASWFAQMSDFGLFCWWNDWRPEMHHTSSSLSKTVTHVRWWTPLFSCRRRASCFLARFLSGTFLSGSLNWARFPLLSTSSPLLSWAFFWVAHSIEPSFEQIRSFEHLFERSKNRCTLENQIFRKIRIAKALLAPPTGSPSFACWLPWLKLRNNEEN